MEKNDPKRGPRRPNLAAARDDIAEAIKAKGIELPKGVDLSALLDAVAAGTQQYRAENPGAARVSAIPREDAERSADALETVSRALLETLRVVPTGGILEGARVTLTAVAAEGGRFHVAVKATTPGIRESSRVGETADGEPVTGAELDELADAMKSNRGRRAGGDESAE